MPATTTRKRKTAGASPRPARPKVGGDTPTANEILDELSRLGSESIKRTLVKHGAREPFFGVKIEHLKKIAKRVGPNHDLAQALYGTGNSDAMYLAGYLAEPQKMSRADLQRWAQGAYWSLLSGTTVAAVAGQSPHGAELALKWIDSKQDQVAVTGWSTFSYLASLVPDDELDLPLFEKLLDRAERSIHSAPNRVRYSMNGFVIAVGCGVKPLSKRAQAVAKAIGDVDVDMGETSCKVPNALGYIRMVIDRGKLGAKRKTALC